jgi:dihydropteroate synthase
MAAAAIQSVDFPIASRCTPGKLRRIETACKLPMSAFWETKRQRIDLSRRACVMGILNVTPDSFSDGGRHDGVGRALEHARQMIENGVDMIDVGGESTRPGAIPVDHEEEIRRTRPVIQQLRREWPGLISIDTSKAKVAASALEAGADVVNDITGLRGDPAMVGLCADARCGVVVMHMQGRPQTMQRAPHYEDVVAEVSGFFRERMDFLTSHGLAQESVVLDPGIGFGKTLDHNLALLRGLARLVVDGRPLLLGASRKSFIAGVLGVDDPELREWPTVAVTAFARERGVMIHRVHDVRRNREALRMVEAVLGV